MAHDAPHWGAEALEHVAPMGHHIEREAAFVAATVVPAWALARLLLAVEDPRAGLDPD